MASNAHRRQAEDEYLLAHPYVVSQGQSPWKRYVDSTTDDHVFADSSAEKTQQTDAESRGQWPRWQKKEALAGDPQHFLETVGTAIEVRIRKQVKTNGHFLD